MPEIRIPASLTFCLFLFIPGILSFISLCQCNLVDLLLACAQYLPACAGNGVENVDIANKSARAVSPAWSFNLLIVTPGTLVFEKNTQNHHYL